VGMEHTKEPLHRTHVPLARNVKRHRKPTRNVFASLTPTAKSAVPYASSLPSGETSKVVTGW
jgi:hypothetical protein